MVSWEMSVPSNCLLPVYLAATARGVLFAEEAIITMAKKILVALGALGAIALIPLALLAQPGARSILVSENDPGLKKPDYGTSTGQTATPTDAGVFGETFGVYEPRPPVLVTRGTMVVARSEFD
jgi:hypothetical protein